MKNDCLLASTGFDPTSFVAAAIGLLGLGAIAVLLARRRGHFGGPTVLLVGLAVAMLTVLMPGRAFADESDSCQDTVATATPTATASATATPTATPTATSTPTTIPDEIDLSLTSELSSKTVQVGGSLTHTLRVANVTGADSSGGLQVFVAAVSGITGGYTGTGWREVNSDSTGITYQYEAVVPAGGAAAELTATLQAGIAGEALLSAEILAGTGGDSVARNNAASDAVTVSGLPDLTIEVIPDGPVLPLPGGMDIRYTVTNLGPAAADGSQIRVTLSKTDQETYNLTTVPGGWGLDAETATSFTLTSTKALAAGESDTFVLAYFCEFTTMSASVAFPAAVSGGGQVDTSNDEDVATVSYMVP